MKIAFVENRYKTFFWDALARQLVDAGHQIVWLVQNPNFMPVTGTITVLPFPRGVDLTEHRNSPALDFIRRSDRNINHFGGNSRHYVYYKRRIDAWLNAEMPDLVIGESTLFHELMVIEWCKNRQVIFMHPTMPGYPGGRFTISAADTKTPLGINVDVPADDECLTIANAIQRRERVPEYMVPPSAADPSRVQPLPRSLRDRLTIMRGYMSGERYNTPAPWVKWKLDRRVRQHLRNWTKISKEKYGCAQDKHVALYPLQMQPEANLDVWGQPYRDQAELIYKLADALPEGWHLEVKANPKSKYELSSELIDVLRDHPRVSPIPLEQGMAEALARAELVCTVTGTVAVECVLSGKPLVQFGPSNVPLGPGCVQLDSTSQIFDVALQVESGEFMLAIASDRVALVRRLYMATFPGRVSDPATSPSTMALENVKRVAACLLDVKQQCN